MKYESAQRKFVFLSEIVFTYRGLAFVLTGRPRNDDARWFRAFAKLKGIPQVQIGGLHMAAVGQYALTGFATSELEASLDARSPNFRRIAQLNVVAMDDLPWELHSIYDGSARLAAIEAYQTQQAAL